MRVVVLVWVVLQILWILDSLYEKQTFCEFDHMHVAVVGPLYDAALQTQFNKELSSKVQIDMSSSGSAKGKLMAEYKMGKLTAVGTVPVTSLSAQGLGQPTFEITSTYDF